MGRKENTSLRADPLGAVNPRFLVISLILIVLAVYINAAFAKFVWDDQTIVVRNKAIKSFENIPFIFTHDFAKMTNYNGNIYRPMQELTYMADFFLWGMNPEGFHVTNILFQIGCALFLFYVVMAINGSKSVAFFSALIFGIHPINTEAVTYISGRSDPLCLLFLLSSFFFYIRSEDFSKILVEAGYLVVSLVLFSLSLLSRETALVFPAILVGYEIYKINDKKYKNFFKIFPFIIITAVFLVVRSKILPIANVIQNQPVILQGAALSLPPLLSKIIVKYLCIMLLPIELHMWNAQDLVKSTIEREFFLNISVLIVLAITTIVMVKKNRKLCFWVSWFIIFLLPHINIIKLNAPFAEHWVFAASVGIYVIVSDFIFKIVSKYNITKRAAFIFLSLIVMYLSFLTIRRNMDWRDEPSIYNNTLKYARFPKVLSNLGVYYEINGQYDKSIEALKEAITLSPREALYHNNIAVVYKKMGETDLAIQHWKKSLEINSDQPEVSDALSGSLE